MKNQFIKISSIVKISKGKKASFHIGNQKEGEVRFIQIDDLRNNFNIKFTSDPGLSVSKNDVIIAWDGANAGTAGYGISGIIGSTLAKLEIINPEILPSYLGYFLQTKSKFLRQKSTGATIPHISKEVLFNLEIPLLTIKEQELIVSKLDQIRTLHKKRIETTNLLDEYLNSVFFDIFGDPNLNAKKWAKTSLRKITKKITDGTHQSPKFLDHGIPFIFISNIIDDKINLNTKKYISEETYTTLTKSTPIEIGDILYTTVGSYGNPAIVETDEKFSFQRHIAHIKPNSDLTNIHFLFGLLKSPYIKRQADEKARGVAQKTLNLRELGDFEVILPPRNTQDKYAEKVIRTEKLKQSMINQSHLLELQFQSLLQKTFAGQM